MSDNPTGKNGFERVVARIKKEGKRQLELSEPEIDRWLENVFDSHAFVDIFTEAGRDQETAYFRSHIYLYVILGQGLIITALSALLYWRW